MDVSEVAASISIDGSWSVVGSSIAPESEPELDTVALDEDQIPQPHQAAADAGRALPLRIGGRYLVQDEIGRGGMAVVYRVTDSVSGLSFALKRLKPAGSERREQELIAAFEREYHTLVQLSHPRIIAVHDFGADDHGRYYTMELLDGGDLRERAPMGWREACGLSYDVCSSLALLHSRRLVHRDISPRNVRTTREGRAKLIDFGAMAPMGAGGQVIGTPPFVPPEVLYRSTLDARTDLFSLGATLYFALTARFAYPARDFAKLHEAWAQRPAPPSAFSADIPPALDALVMSLISLDPATRPRSAFEVMQRLAALADLDREASDVSQAYLSTPTMAGRDALLADLGSRMRQAVGGRGNSLLIEGASGVGRTRMLDACALDAKLAGALVLRVNAGSEGGETLAAALSLATQLTLALPEKALACARSLKIADKLFETADTKEGSEKPAELRPVVKQLSVPGANLQSLQPGLTTWLSRLSDAHPLAILIDDLHEVDEASLSLLAALALGAQRRRMFVLATARTGAEPQAPDTFAVFRRACAVVDLPALGREDVDSLASSVFGDVPNLALLTERLYQVAAGNPRETLEIIQALSTRGVLRYEGGQWHLPDRLAVEELPSSAIELCKQRVAALSPLARQLAEVHALASHPSLSRQDYAIAAGEAPAAEVDAAISELVSNQLLAGDALAYVLSRREWAYVLDSGLDEAARAARHRTLAEMYAQDAARAMERALHLLAGGCDALAVDLLVQQLVNTASSGGVMALTTLNPVKVSDLLDRALTSAEQLGRTPREIQELRRGVFAISVATDEARYYRVAPALLAQLKYDSGLDAYLQLSDAEPKARLMRALTQAKAQYDAASDEERVWPPDVAIKSLTYYVAISIAIGSRAQDHALIASLPALMEPFAPLSPLVHAMWQNAIATRETVCDNRPEQARQRWFEVETMLANVTAADMSYVSALRGAIAYGIASIEARLGISTAEAKAKTLDSDPMQRASAMSLRRVVRLHNGDLTGAERYRKQAELLALHGNLRQMFTSTLVAELLAHALACDLTGIREASQSIGLLAARFPGWKAHHYFAEGCFEHTRGQFARALAAFEQGLAVARPDPADPNRSTGAWPRLEGAYVETLVSLGRNEEARACGLQALARCEEHGIGVSSFVIRRALALAEGKLGDYAGASARLDHLIQELKALDIRGLELGATYEARARVAIWASEREAAEQYGRMTAQEYRYGQSSPLGARYERLMDEARTAGVTALPELGDVMTSHLGTAWTVDVFRKNLDGTDGSRELAERTLRLVCESRGLRSGYLYRKTPEAFELVAFHGESPDPLFQHLLTGRLKRLLEQRQEASMIKTATTLAEDDFRDRRGIPHQPTLLMTESGGVEQCAGAIILEVGVQPATVTQTQTQELLEALALCVRTDSGQVAGVG